MIRTQLHLTIETAGQKTFRAFYKYGRLLVLLCCFVFGTENVFAVPAKITNLTATIGFQIMLTWTAPNNGDATGACGSYLVKYSTSANITNETEFLNAATYYQSWAPKAPSSSESIIVTGLIPDTTYWFSIKASSSGVWSAIADTGTNVAVAGPFYVAWSAVDSDTNTIRAIWGDYDNDGDMDIVACKYRQANRVYRNDGISGFNPVWDCQEALDSTFGIFFGDYDNDGDLDQSVANYDSQPNRVYRNDGNGLFAKVWDSQENENSLTAIWGDYDNDGDLDQFVANYNSAAWLPNRIYRNDGNGSFALTWTCPTTQLSVSAAWGDCDNDGVLEVLVGNNGTLLQNQRDRLYKNDGFGGFNEVWNSGATDTVSTMCVMWGDYDNDARLDQLIGNYGNVNRIYKNNGTSFSKVWNNTDVSYTRSVFWGDYDNDGDLDQLVGNDILPSNTYRNDGGNLFRLIGATSEAENTWSVAWGDYDNDDDLDGLSGNRTKQNKIYKSEMSLKKLNTMPSSPDSFTSTIYNGAIVFLWDESTDSETTLSKGLYYEIRIATEPITDNLGKWIVSPSTGAGMSPIVGNYYNSGRDSTSGKPGFAFKPMIEDTTYYYQVRAIDTGLKHGDWSSEQLAYSPLPGIPVLSSPVNGSTTNQLVITFDWGDSISPSVVIGYEMHISTAPDFSGTVISSLTANSYCRLPALYEGTWYWTVRSSDTLGYYSSWASTYSVIIDTSPPDLVNNLLAVTGFNPGEIDLIWTSPGDDRTAGDITGGAYRVRYSTYVLASAGFWTSSSADWTIMGSRYQIDWSTNTQALSEQSYTIKKLPGDVTYYVCLWARDEVPGSSDWNGNWSGISNGATIYVQHYFADSIKPKPPAGIRTSLNGNRIEIRWSAVSENEDGSDLIDGRGYNVYRSDNLTGGWAKIGLIPGIDEQYCVWIGTITDSKVYYYKINTLDNLDNESSDSMIADSSQDLNIFALSSDKQVMISIPQSISTALLKAAQGDDVTIKIDKSTKPDNAGALAEYELTAVKSLNDEKIPKFVFPDALAKLSFTYDTYSSGNVALFWFNGVEWLKIGTEKEGNALTFLTNRLGKYAIKTAQTVNEFTFTKVYPRIFSPNNDGRNDYVEFQFENPKNSVVTGNIFDLRNGLVSGLKKGNNDNSLIWDGKTSDGETASPGIYIYQLEISGAETKTVNGTVIVAR